MTPQYNNNRARRESLATTVDIMRSHGIRHLPVLDGYRLYGIVSDRDVQEIRVQRGQSWKQMQLGEICQRDVVTASPTAPVASVAQQMLDEGTGSAVGGGSRREDLRIFSVLALAMPLEIGRLHYCISCLVH